MAAGYSAVFKQEVLDYLHDSGLGKAQVCRDKDISRDTLYNWIDEETSIRAAADAEKTAMRKREATQRELDRSTEELASRHGVDLAEMGDRKLRKTKMGEQVERLLFGVISVLENYKKLDELHPKDLGQLAERLHKIKQQLYEEPQYIVEVRNRYIRDSLTVLKELEVPQGTVEQFADKMAQIEQAEVVG